MALCLVALGVLWIAMSAGPRHAAPPGARDGRLAARPPCKPCKDRAWCAWTREGRPRTSCDPCCYQGPNDALPICVD